MDPQSVMDPMSGGQMYRWAFEQSPVAIALIDATMRIVNCNEAMAQLVASSRERVVGLGIDDMRDQRFRSAVKEALAGSVVAYESPYHTTTGDVWLWARATFAPVRDDAGRVIAVMALAGDLSPPRVGEPGAPGGEVRLVESQRLGQVGSWTWDTERKVADASPEFYRILGIEPGTLGGPRDFAQCVHAEDRAILRAHRGALHSLKLTHTTCDCRVLRPDGAVRFVVVRTFVQYDGAGQPCAAWGTLQDVTERRELEEQLGRAQRMEALGQLAGGVAHDFNNLLTVIGMATEFLREGLSRDDPLTAEVEAIRSATRGAAGLTRQLLAFSGRRALRRRQLDLNEVVRETVRMLGRLLGKDIELAIALEPQLPPMLGDPGQLEQVLINLAVNARDAMPEGGVLTIATKRVIVDSAHPTLPAGEYLVLIVSDTGYGMDEFVRRRIFDPFFTTKPPGRGTGLGLSTVLGIIERAGGRIEVDSEPGRGARFTIHLPRSYGGDELADQRARRDDRPTGPEAGTTVLLVEDDSLLRHAFQRILQREGYRVLVAADGYEALAVAQAFDGRLDLVVTDVVMPRLGARDMVARLRDVRPGVQALYVSSYSEDEILRRVDLGNAASLLEKPFSASDLADAVREALRSTG